MIRLRGVGKAYSSRQGRKVVLDGVDYEFPPGRNTAVIGQNGAGKSTLMRLVSGAEMPDSGVVERSAQVSWPLGFKGGLHGSLTGAENVAFVSRIYGRDFREMLAFVEEFAEIGRAMGEQTKGYSSGMKARVAFGISMAIRFDYYLIDEVIAVGDASFKRKCKRVLSQRMETATVLLISHSPGLMKEFCQHGCVLNEGRIVFDGGIEEAIAAYDSIHLD